MCGMTDVVGGLVRECGVGNVRRASCMCIEWRDLRMHVVTVVCLLLLDRVQSFPNSPPFAASVEA